jgi:hypothetical protein
MGKRKKNNPDNNQMKAAPLVDRLPFRPPFTKEEWGHKSLSDVVANPVFFDYLEKCLKEAVRVRGHFYVRMLAGIAHMGRISEFNPQSYDKFLEEACEQHFTVAQLKNALEIILNTSGPEDILPNSAAAFEFLTFISDFVNAFAEHMGAGGELKSLTEKVRMMGLLAFANAVNAEFGLQKDLWKAGN